MKKTLVLLCSLLMVLSVVPMTALAVSVDYYYDFQVENDDDLNSNGDLVLGKTYKYKLVCDGDDYAPEMPMSTSCFSVSAKWDSGSKYVTSARLDGDYLVLKLKDSANTDDTDLAGTITLYARKDLRKRDGYKDYVYILTEGQEYELEINQKVAAATDTIEPGDDRDDPLYIEGEGADTEFKAKNRGYVAFYAEERGFEALLRFGTSEKVYVNIDTSEIDKVADKYDVDYDDVSYFTFDQSPTIKNSAVLSIEDDDHVYEWDGKKLTEVETTRKDGRYQWPVSSRLSAYVVSDTEITAASQTSESSSSSSSSASNATGGGIDKNPDTGR